MVRIDCCTRTGVAAASIYTLNIVLTTPVPWLLVVNLPLLLALLITQPRLWPVMRRLAAWAAAPALLLAAVATGEVVVETPLLLGMRLGLTGVTRVFLLFTATLWLLAGIYAQAYMARDPALNHFWGFYLLTLGGNLGVLLARDLVSFYLFFTVMGFAAYGLVAHNRSPTALQAARIYLILVIMGEAFLLPAMLLTAITTASYNLELVPLAIAQASNRNLIIGLLLAGFGVKAGALLLHMWLPLAHPAAPTPASAVLSGTMIKAGLLGWLLFLPLGAVALPEWGTVCMLVGLGATFYGVAIGLTQPNPKTILAYSSISQMGLMTVALAVTLMAPAERSLVLMTIMIYATHHALAKGALFLSVGMAAGASRVWHVWLVGVGTTLAALSMTGAPLSSGAIAKAFLKDATHVALPPWPGWLALLLQLSALATTLLMGRFLLAVWPQAQDAEKRLPLGMWLSWLTLLALMLGWFYVLPPGLLDAINRTLTFSALWPLVVGTLIVAAVHYGQRRWQQRTGNTLRLVIPEGDVLVLVIAFLHALRRGWQLVVEPRWKAGWHHMTWRWSAYRQNISDWPDLARMERWLRFWPVAGTLFVVLVLVILALTH